MPGAGVQLRPGLWATAEVRGGTHASKCAMQANALSALVLVCAAAPVARYVSVAQEMAILSHAVRSAFLSLTGPLAQMPQGKKIFFCRLCMLACPATWRLPHVGAPAGSCCHVDGIIALSVVTMGSALPSVGRWWRRPARAARCRRLCHAAIH